MNFESRTHPMAGHDFKQKPLHFQIPSMEPKRRAISLYGVLPAVQENRMDVLFEWMASDGMNWTMAMDPNGVSGMKCQFPKLEPGQHYTTDIVPRDLVRKIGGRSVYKAACAMPRTVKLRLTHGECVNVTITGQGVPAEAYPGGKHVMLTCPTSFKGHAKLVMCMNTPLYGFPIIGSKIAQWIEYYTYMMKSDVHFFIYMHRHGTASIVQGLALLYPYVRDGLVTIVWEDEWTTARFFERRQVSHQLNGNHCLSRAKHHSTWIANTVDVDEFIAPFKFNEKTGGEVWADPLPAPPNATGLLDFGAILDKAEHGLTSGCPLQFPKSKYAADGGCKVNIFDMYKWAVQPVDSAHMNKPGMVGTTLTPANGKHIMRTSAVAIMAIHTEVAFEEAVDWNNERVVQTLSSDPQRWKFIKHRNAHHLSDRLLYPDGVYPPSMVEYQMLHFNKDEWNRWVVDEENKLVGGINKFGEESKKVAISPYVENAC